MIREIKISQSEVSTYNACEKKHQFAFINKLEPREQSLGIARGNVGHLMFETFLKTGKKELALAEGIKSDATNASALIPRFSEWVDSIYPMLGWKKVVAVEETYYLEVEQDVYRDHEYKLIFPFMVDAIVEKSNGELILVDHKFLADYYSNDTIQVAKQLPLYIGALRALGHNISGAMYNMVRTRSNAVDKFRQEMLYPSDNKVQSLFREHVTVSKRILRAKIDAEIAGKSEAIKVADPMVCKWCPFATICAESMDGKVNQLSVRAKFQPNSYGY